MKEYLVTYASKLPDSLDQFDIYQIIVTANGAQEAKDLVQGMLKKNLEEIYHVVDVTAMNLIPVLGARQKRRK